MIRSVGIQGKDMNPETKAKRGETYQDALRAARRII
jgi:hypothetical protein